jgi:protein-disulfide isomerase
MSSKSPKKRQPAQSKVAQAEQARKRRNILLASLVAVAVVAVAVVLLAGGGDDDKTASNTGGKVAGLAETKELLDGIPQQGATLGKKDAPVTLVEFADLQCPFCREFALSTYPVIVNDYVREGKVRIEFRTLTFIGPDSEKGARAAAAAGEQDREAEFTQLWYFNQGPENSGYATQEFIDKLWKAAGVDVAQAKKFLDSQKSLEPVDAAQRDAEKFGVVSTPTFLIGETGKELTKFDVNLDDPDAFKAAFDELLKGT